MRDVFWTIIVIWLIYQLVNIFKSAGKKKYAFHSNDEARSSSQTTSAPPTKKDVKTAIKKHADNEGEYIDYEEIK
ncbi:MAG: DUF4834 family protein [Bacteroidetes bacterium]|nr:DUF4834 family protein [Bacteroidota bacterium]